MNFSLTEEQEFLQEAARGALGAREDGRGGARGARGRRAAGPVAGGDRGRLAGAADLARTSGGAGLGADRRDARVRRARPRAGVRAAAGHLPATLCSTPARRRLRSSRSPRGTRARASFRREPPSAIEEALDRRPALGARAGRRAGVAGGQVTGEVAWVPDAPGADVLVVVVRRGHGERGRARPRTPSVEPVDALRRDALARARALRRRAGDRARRRDGLIGAPGTSRRRCWRAESLGAVERALEVSVQYAKERFTFGRAIGSYQAMKHQLVEILRRLDNARSLMYYAGWAGADKPEEFALAASAFRLVAGKALDEASRMQISVHGGIGATWEHDAPLYFRRAQLSRRLLGGDRPGGRPRRRRAVRAGGAPRPGDIPGPDRDSRSSGERPVPGDEGAGRRRARVRRPAGAPPAGAAACGRLARRRPGGGADRLAAA